jgi:hypothetical protein
MARETIRLVITGPLKRAAYGDARLPPKQAARELALVYGELNRAGNHLLDDLLAGTSPSATRQPPDGAADAMHGYQWYYQADNKAELPGSNQFLGEIGYFHLFAREEAWMTFTATTSGQAFARSLGVDADEPGTRHLLGIGIDARGLPSRLFTVNSWVTGDTLLTAQASAALLADMRLATGFALIDRVICSICAVYGPEIRRLLETRDAALMRALSDDPKSTSKPTLEVLSELPVDVEDKIKQLLEGS